MSMFTRLRRWMNDGIDWVFDHANAVLVGVMVGLSGLAIVLALVGIRSCNRNEADEMLKSRGLDPTKCIKAHTKSGTLSACTTGQTLVICIGDDCITYGAPAETPEVRTRGPAVLAPEKRR